MPRNGNGRDGGNGRGGGVPRWVRTLFDQHEAHMAQMERKREEDKAEHGERMAAHEARMAAHEARMGELERLVRIQQNEQVQMRLQTARLVHLVDKQRQDHNLLVRFVKQVDTRLSRIEGK